MEKFGGRFKRRSARRLWLLGTAASVGLSLLGAQGAIAQTAQPTPSTATPSGTVENVVVTARRTSENLQDVPLAISVINADSLQALGQDNLRDLYLQIPTLRVVDTNPRNAGVTIRGLGANLANEGLVNSVGVFVDGVYYPRPGAAAFGQFDIAQIEVLRGPQGTLFGKNTTAGALNITTRKPSFNPGGELEASFGDYGYYNLAGTVTGPISDTLAFRLTASLKGRDGFLKNIVTGQKLNDDDEKILRGQLLWKPNQAFSLRVIADYEFQRIHCCTDVIVSNNTTYDDGTVIPNNFAFRAAKVGYTPLPIDPFARHTDIDSPQLFRTGQYGLSAEANYSMGPATLTSLTAFRGWMFDPHNDLDFTGASILTQGAYKSRSHDFSEELRLSSKVGSDFDYVIGGYYLYEPLASVTLQSFGASAGGWILPTLPTSISQPALNGLFGAGDDRAYTESFAAFGQGTWRPTAKLSLTGGLRYTYEKKWGYSVLGPPMGGAPLSSFAAALQPTINAIRAGTVIAYDTRTIAGFPQDYDEGDLSGTVSAGYKFTSDINGYVSYARGYKSGGINFAIVPTGASQIIRPEIADDYEVGLKTVLLDRRVVLNTALYWTDVSDYQSTQLYLNPANGSFTSYVTNAAQIRSRGFEIDGEAVIAQGISATASVAYTDAKYTSYTNAPCALVNAAARCDLSGTRLPNVSRWSLHAGAHYAIPYTPLQIDGEGVRPVIDADVSYRTGFLGGASQRTNIDGYTVVNLTFSLRLDRHGTTLSFWAHNLFDEQYYVTKAPLIFNTGPISGELGDPRTVGVTLRKTF